MHHRMRIYRREPRETPEWAMGYRMEKETFRLLDDHRRFQRMEPVQRTWASEARSWKIPQR